MAEVRQQKMNGEGKGAAEPTFEASCFVEHTIGTAPRKSLLFIAVPAGEEEGAYG
jgi:hypothetical protein